MKALFRKKKEKPKEEAWWEEEAEPKKSFFTILREKWEGLQARYIYSGMERPKGLIVKQFIALCLAIFYGYVTLELYKISSVYLIVFVPTIYLLLDYIRETRKREEK